MEVIKGTDRLVVPVGKHVLKFPRVSAGVAIDITIDAYEVAGLSGIQMAWEGDSEDAQTLSGSLLHGLAANNREARLARIFPDIVQLTHIFARGLLNVQPLTPSVTLPGSLVKDIFASHLPDRISQLTHMIDDPGNFGICDDGRVRFLDGGDRGLERLLSQEHKYDQIAAALQELKIATSELQSGL